MSITANARVRLQHFTIIVADKENLTQHCCQPLYRSSFVLSNFVLPGVFLAADITLSVKYPSDNIILFSLFI